MEFPFQIRGLRIRPDGILSIMELGRRSAELDRRQPPVYFGPEQLRAQPEAFRLFRTPDGEVVGYAACLALHRAQPEDIAVDPGAAALWRYAQEHRPPRPGEQVLAWRFHVDHNPDESRPRASGTILGAWHVADMLLRPEEIDLDYSPLQLEDTFADEDERTLAATA